LSKATWDSFWEESGAERVPDIDVEREFRSFYWRQLEPRLRALHGDLRGLKTIELGAGAGVISLLLGIKGARPTLLDFSPQALAAARALFDRHQVAAEFVEADLHALPATMDAAFDVSLSLGTGEHFEGAERQAFWEVHHRLLRSPGLAFVSVPNAACLPYRCYERLARATGAWEVGLEIPYDREEIRSRVAALAARLELAGSPLFNDSCYFLLGGALKLLGRVLVGAAPGAGEVERVRRRERFSRAVDQRLKRIPLVTGPLDARWGYSLVAMIERG